MRIEIDEDLEAVLDQIREENWHVTGKGHSDTVRFLARFYKEHQALTETAKQFLAQVHETIKSAVKQALKEVFTNILS